MGDADAPMDEARQDALAEAIMGLDDALGRARERLAELAQRRRARGTARTAPPALKRATGTGTLRLPPGQERPRGTARTAPPAAAPRRPAAGDPLAAYARRGDAGELERLVAAAEADGCKAPEAGHEGEDVPPGGERPDGPDP